MWRERLGSFESRLDAQTPLNQLRREQQRLDYLLENLRGAMRHRFELGNERVQSLASRLDALSPLAVLKRGYSITRREDGKVVRAASEVKTGDVLRSKLAEDEVRSVVS